MPHRTNEAPVSRSRRQVLKRLGLAFGVAYAAPAMLGFGPARASGASGASGSSGPSGGGSSSSGASPGGSFSQPQRRRRLVVLEFVALVPAARSADNLAAAGYQVLALAEVPLLASRLLRIAAPPGAGSQPALAELRGLLPGAEIAPNDLYAASEFACDSDGCEAFQLIGWRPPAACHLSPVIGMVDTNVNPQHPALVASRLEQVAVEQAGRTPASAVHGTAVAVLLVGDGGSSTPGLLPHARLLAAEAFHAGVADAAADAFGLVVALDRLAAESPAVINMSLAGPDNPVLARAVAAVLAADIPIVAAAGNAGSGAPPLFPAAFPGVVAVTAVDTSLSVYRQAIRGEHISFAAPGVRLWTAASVSGGRFRSGTSYAAPFVTAAIAALRARQPDLGMEAALDRLATEAQDLGDPGRDDVFGWGLIQAAGICT